MKVATVQFQHKANDKPYNLAQIEYWTKAASRDGVELVVFPEMCVTGYWHVHAVGKSDVAALAEPIPAGPSTSRLLQLAKAENISVGAGLIEKAGDGQFYNLSLIHI